METIKWVRCVSYRMVKTPKLEKKTVSYLTLSIVFATLPFAIHQWNWVNVLYFFGGAIGTKWLIFATINHTKNNIEYYNDKFN